MLVLLDDGTLRGWGRGQRGMLGEPHGPDSALPKKLPWISDATELVVYGWRACAHAKTGAWWCWDRDHAPAIDPHLADARSIVLGTNYGCALRANGTVACWGFAPGHYRSSMLETKLPPASPHEFAEVSELHDVTALASGGDHVCAVEADGSVWCWGSDSRGQVSGGELAFDSDRVVDKPTKVVKIAHAVDIAATSFRTCTHVGGSTWCWGEGAEGPRRSHGPFVPGASFEICERSGNGIQCGIAEPIIAREVDRSGGTTCTIDGYDVVRCAGENRVGELGDGTLVSRKDPQPVVGLVEGRGAPLPAAPAPADARDPAWAVAPCKHDATLQFTVTGFATTPFVVRGSFARLTSDIPMLTIDLTDHPVGLDELVGFPKPAGDQRTIQLVLSNFNAKEDFQPITPGRYRLGHPAPGKVGETKAVGSSAFATNISDKPDFAGAIQLDQLTDGWACGSIDAKGPGGTIRGRFAAERVP